MKHALPPQTHTAPSADIYTKPEAISFPALDTNVNTALKCADRTMWKSLSPANCFKCFMACVQNPNLNRELVWAYWKLTCTHRGARTSSSSFQSCLCRKKTWDQGAVEHTDLGNGLWIHELSPRHLLTVWFCCPRGIKMNEPAENIIIFPYHCVETRSLKLFIQVTVQNWFFLTLLKTKVGGAVLFFCFLSVKLFYEDRSVCLCALVFVSSSGLTF